MSWYVQQVYYPIEPHNSRSMRKQLERWSHGFVQNTRRVQLLRLSCGRPLEGSPAGADTLRSIGRSDCGER